MSPKFHHPPEHWTILRRGKDLGEPAEGAGREEQRWGSSPSTVLRRSSPVRGCSSSGRGKSSENSRFWWPLSMVYVHMKYLNDFKQRISNYAWFFFILFRKLGMFMGDFETMWKVDFRTAEKVNLRKFVTFCIHVQIRWNQFCLKDISKLYNFYVEPKSRYCTFHIVIYEKPGFSLCQFYWV